MTSQSDRPTSGSSNGNSVNEEDSFSWFAKARTRLWHKPAELVWKVPLVPRVIATFFYTGLSPTSSGTVGSLAAALLYYFIPPLQNNAVLLVVTVALFIAGVWASNIVERTIHEHDPSIIVADEAVGQWIALMTLSYAGNLLFVAIAFVMFRLFDIMKVYPASVVERRKGGFSVMFDDVIAGVYANVAAHLIMWLLTRFVIT